MVRHRSLPWTMVETKIRNFNSLETVGYHDGAEQSKRLDGIVCLISQILSELKQINHLHTQPTWGPTHLEFYHLHNFCCLFKHLVAAAKINNWNWKYLFAFESNRNGSRKKKPGGRKGERMEESDCYKIHMANVRSGGVSAFETFIQFAMQPIIQYEPMFYTLGFPRFGMSWHFSFLSTRRCRLRL